MNPIALPIDLSDLSDIVDAAVKDATGADGTAVSGTHLELEVGASRVRLICVPTPRPRASIVEELGELLGRAAVDPFTVAAVATYGAVFVVIPSKIGLRFAERDPNRRPS